MKALSFIALSFVLANSAVAAHLCEGSYRLTEKLVATYDGMECPEVMKVTAIKLQGRMALAFDEGQDLGKVTVENVLDGKVNVLATKARSFGARSLSGTVTKTGGRAVAKHQYFVIAATLSSAIDCTEDSATLTYLETHRNGTTPSRTKELRCQYSRD